MYTRFMNVDEANLFARIVTSGVLSSLLTPDGIRRDFMYIMFAFKRNWDSSCPHDWASWEQDGAKWVIRDLRPEDDGAALKLILEYLCRDELLCSLLGMRDDPVSMSCADKVWRLSIAQRLSLGCYEEKDGKSKLVGLNVCLVSYKGEKHNYELQGKAMNNMIDAMAISEESVDCFELLGVDKYLHGLGLIVHPDYRSKQLGSKILDAREPMCLLNGIYGTMTVFSGPRSQKSAARVGFKTVATHTLKQLADAGLDFPEDESRCIKLMVKKYEAKTDE